MPNPLFNGMNNMSGGNPLIQNIMNAVNMARKGGNPQAAQQIQSMLQSGQNPMNLAMGMLRQRGIDPEQLKTMLGIPRR